MKVSVIGVGYVGLVTGVSLASAGHTVVCIGRNKEKVNAINFGKAPFFEPGLNALLKRVIAKKHFIASVNFASCVVDSDITIIAVGTPTVNGAIDLTQIQEATHLIGKSLSHKSSYHVVAVKSTVIPGTTESVVWRILCQTYGKSSKDIGVCMNPEFLREGNAIEDALDPDRIVIGSSDHQSAKIYSKLFAKNTCPIFLTNLATAEMCKYVSNTVLATLVSFSNEVGRLASRTPGVDVVDIWRIIHADGRWSPKVGGKRITPGIVRYLATGCGYGGSCFPKDTKALLRFASDKGVQMPILGDAIHINAKQPYELIELLKSSLVNLRGKRIAVLGLAFKPNTDDVRESPAITLIKILVSEGAEVVCHDPQVYREGIPELLSLLRASFTDTWEQALKDSSGLVLVTAWDVYRKISPRDILRYMKKPLVIDGRRFYDPKKFIHYGIDYRAVGRAP